MTGLRDENKRRQVIAIAAKFFSASPYHKVRLDEIATEAGIGKGTIYIYFKNKEDLYYCMVTEGFAELIQRLKQQLSADLTHFEQGFVRSSPGWWSLACNIPAF